MATSMPENTHESFETLKSALFGALPSYRIPTYKFCRKGKGRGILLGGNLSVLYSICGSPSALNTRDSLLIIEDIGEYTYHIDRMLMNLKRNGYFDKLHGLIVGGMTQMKETDRPFRKTIKNIILDIVAEYSFPVVFEFPVGHGPDNRALVMGLPAELSVDQEKATLNYL